MKIIESNNSIILEGVTDFDARHIFECGQSFRWNREADGSYTGVAYGKVINVSSDYAQKTVRIENTCLKDFEAIWQNYFDLRRDYGSIKAALSTDPIMEAAIGYGAGIRILSQEPWEILISFIISANKSIPGIAKCIELLSQMYGVQLRYRGKLYHAFPTAERLAKAPLDELLQCKAGYRCKYIHEAAGMIARGEIDLAQTMNMDMDEARKELMRVPGVGPKVADCIMLFSMQKYQAYPVDVWIKRGTEHFFLHKEVSMKEIQAFAREKFGDLAGFAQEYLFYYARTMKI